MELAKGAAPNKKQERDAAFRAGVYNRIIATTEAHVELTPDGKMVDRDQEGGQMGTRFFSEDYVNPRKKEAAPVDKYVVPRPSTMKADKNLDSHSYRLTAGLDGGLPETSYRNVIKVPLPLPHKMCPPPLPPFPSHRPSPSSLCPV
jgi:hypothetical protein